MGTGGATRFDFGFANIDTLLFQSATSSKTNDPFGCGAFNCTQFTMDDVSVALKNPPVPSIPEPSSIALMLVGLGSLGLLKKFRAH